MDTIQPQPSPNHEEEEAMDLRTNPFQEGGDDGRGPSTSPHASPPKGRFGPTIELWPRGSKKTFFYMFKCHKL